MNSSPDGNGILFFAKRKDIMDSGTTGLRKTDDVLLNKKKSQSKDWDFLFISKLNSVVQTFILLF